MLGVMLDCSRNAVYTKEALFRFIDLLAKMGYDTLQLYTEDTYEIEGEPYFGYLRGRYTADELREVDAYCRRRGIELQPCIQTLAHLRTLQRWEHRFGKVMDQRDVLLVGEEETYALIDKMFAQMAKCFTSRRIHIGMDEAHCLGRGRYLDLHGAAPRKDIFLAHLCRVCEIAKRYGFRPMMWGDMFYHLGTGHPYLSGRELTLTDDIKSLVPQDLDLVYWDYYHLDKAGYDLMNRAFAQFDNPILFAGGAWMWRGYAPLNAFSLRTTEAALASCREFGIRDILMTMWGDDGAECSPFSLLPALFYAAELARGNEDMASVKARFREVIGEEFDDMMALDLPNCPGTPGPKGDENPCRYALANDPLRGIHDKTVALGDGRAYAAHARRLRALARAGGEFAYLYRAAAELCSVLEVKYDLGIRLRAAYRGGDRAALAAAAADCRRTARRLRKFYLALRAAWMKEKKPHGFEIQDLRLGGLERRLLHAAELCEGYLAGEISRIPELEEELLYFNGNGTEGVPVSVGFWQASYSPSIIWEGQ